MDITAWSKLQTIGFFNFLEAKCLEERLLHFVAQITEGTF